jgi:hypothetical protein
MFGKATIMPKKIDGLNRGEIILIDIDFNRLNDIIVLVFVGDD